MSMIAMWFKKSLIVAVIAALGLSALPFVSAYAQSANPPVTPGQPSSDGCKRLGQKSRLFMRASVKFSMAPTV